MPVRSSDLAHIRTVARENLKNDSVSADLPVHGGRIHAWITLNVQSAGNRGVTRADIRSLHKSPGDREVLIIKMSGAVHAVQKTLNLSGE